MTQLIIGVFNTEQDVTLVIQELMELGVDKRQDISVLSQDVRELNRISEYVGTKDPEAGLGNNGVWSVVKDLTSDLNVIPHEIAVIGSAASKLSGAGIGGDTDDFVVRLLSIGIPSEDAQKYEDCLLKGNIVLLITSESKMREDVEQVLISHESMSI